jgi:hypothetical protein
MPRLLAPVSAQALEEGALDTLVEVLLGASPAGRLARRHAVRLIGSFSVAPAFRRAVVQHPRAIAAVVQLIKQPDSNIQVQAAAALHVILLRSPQACRAAADAGAVPALVACMGEGAGDNLCMTALGPLFFLVSGSTSRARAAAAVGAVPALCSLAGIPATSRHMVVHEALVVRTLLEIITACPPAPKVASACARGLVRRLQQQQQATAASGGSRRDDPTQLAAALEVLLRSSNASSQEAASSVSFTGGRAKPSLRLPEGVIAAGGVEAALAQLRGPAAQEAEEQEDEEEGVAGRAAAGLLCCLLACSEPAAEECHRRVLAAGGVTPVVQFFVRSMAAGGSSRQGVAAHLILLLLVSGGGVVPARSSLCSWATAVEAGVVPVLGCLAGSGHPDDESVQGQAAMALGALAAAPCRSSPDRCRQLPEPLHSALQPAVAALAGLLHSMQLPAVRAAVLIALGNIALVDKALVVEVVAAGAGQLAAQWSLRPGAPAEVVRAAERLLMKLAFQGDTVPAAFAVAAVPAQPSSSDSMESAAGPGQGGGSIGQAVCCAVGSAASRPDGKPLMLCSACRHVSYCSGACQRRHWGEHKGACRRVGV